MNDINTIKLLTIIKMKDNRILLKLIFISCLFNLYLGNDLAGAKLAVHESSLKVFFDAFLPDIAKLIGHIRVPDQHADVDAGICTLSVNLSGIEIMIGGFQPGNFKISVKQPNRINLVATGLGGRGQLRTDIKCGILPSASDTVIIIVKRLDFQSELALDMVHSKVRGKFMPIAYITQIGFPVFDFDISMSGSIIGALSNLVKDVIKRYIKGIALKVLGQKILEFSKHAISDPIINLPVYFEFHEFNKPFADDISLTSPFKVVGGFMVLNANGAISNPIIPETHNSPFPLPNNLPDGDQTAKGVQVFLSEYFFNTALFTLFKSNYLKYDVTAKDIPDSIPFKLNTNFLDTLFPGIIDKYGKDEPARLHVSAFTQPLVSLKSQVNTKLTAQFSIQINGSYEECIVFTSDIDTSTTVAVSEGPKLTAEIKSLNLSNSAVQKSLIPNIDISKLESFVNITAKFIIPMVNAQYLKNINITVPDIKGIKIHKMVASFKDGYCEISINPKGARAFRDIIMRQYYINHPEEAENLNELALIWF
jgi:hypothetical protein